MGKESARPIAGTGSDASLKRYLEDIRKAAPLQPGAEITLFRLYRKGSRNAPRPQKERPGEFRALF